MTRAMALSLLVLGCGGGGGDDGGAPPDAAMAHAADLAVAGDLPFANLTCRDWGVISPPKITIAGRVENPLDKKRPAASALVQAIGRDNKEISQVTTGGDGKFSIAIPTGGGGWDGHLKVSKAADAEVVPSYIYRSRPVGADISGAALPLLRKSDLELVSTLAQTAIDPGTATLFVSVQDCDAKGIAGATLGVTPSGPTTKVVYFTEVAGSALPDRKATATAKEGVAVVFNVTGDQVNEAWLRATRAGVEIDGARVGAWKDALVVTFLAQ